jgi:hypothetical protein
VSGSLSFVKLPYHATGFYIVWRQRLNPRKPIFALLALGIALIAALSFVPHTFVGRLHSESPTVIAGSVISSEAVTDAAARRSSGAPLSMLPRGTSRVANNLRHMAC